MENKNKILELIKTNTTQNLFLALTLWKGLGFEVDEVLEWWWEEVVGDVTTDLKYWSLQSCFVRVFVGTMSIRINRTQYNLPNQIRYNRKYDKSFPPLPTIIQNIKNYTFALILHLWEFGEEMVE